MEWEEVQSVVLPNDTPIYAQTTDTGNVRYHVKIFTPDGNVFSVNVSKTNVEMYRSGLIRLELVKWRSRSTGHYKYTIRRYKPAEADINLETLFYGS
jgi:hypothetical protein